LFLIAGVPALAAGDFAPVVPTVTDNGFTAGAVGNIDNDPDLDRWQINDNNALTNASNDV
jgi:hypothetical protein